MRAIHNGGLIATLSVASRSNPNQASAPIASAIDVIPGLIELEINDEGKAAFDSSSKDSSRFGTLRAMLTHLEALVLEVVGSAYREVFGTEPSSSLLEIRPADRPEFGDYTSNIAMLAASELKAAPRDIGGKLLQAISEQIEASPSHPVAKVELAGPGFINFFLTPEAIQGALSLVSSKDVRLAVRSLARARSFKLNSCLLTPPDP